MSFKEEVEWVRLGKNPSGSHRSKKVVGTGMIVKTSDGWDKSKDVGLRTFSAAKEKTREKNNARGYNTLTHDDAVFFDEIIHRETVEILGIERLTLDQNAGFFIGYFHEKEKDIGIIARYVEVRHASGSLFGYGYPKVVEGEDIRKAYRLTPSQLPAELTELKKEKEFTNRSALKAVGTEQFFRVGSELSPLYYCFIHYNNSHEMLILAVGILTTIAFSYLAAKTIPPNLHYRIALKEDFPAKIALKKDELANARQIKMISGKKALDVLCEKYDKS